jgi:Zn-dependent protease
VTGRPLSYSWSSTNATPPGRITTSRTEIRDILIAFVVLTFDLLLILGGTTVLASGSAVGVSFNAAVVALAAAAALTGFLAHELAHKVAAQRRHCWAEFRMFPMGLVLSIFTAFVGFLFAAPGATMVGGMYDVRSWGRTSLAGPATNLVFGTAFFAGAYAAAFLGAGGFVLYALIILAFFNAWFAAFNMIPLGPLDGRKVLNWDPVAWMLAMVASAGLAALAYATVFAGHLLGT